jgi:Fibronectin type III domain
LFNLLAGQGKRYSSLQSSGLQTQVLADSLEAHRLKGEGMKAVKFGVSKMLFVGVLAVLSGCNPTKPSTDFSLAFNPATLNLAVGATGNSTLTLTAIGGFDVNQTPSEVTVEGTGFGAGEGKIQVGDQTQIDATQSSFPFTVGAKVPAGSYDMTVNVTVGSLKRSAKITVKVGTPSTTVPNPTNLTATVISSSQINLAWTFVSNATGYEVEQKVGTAFESLGTVTTPSAEITKLSPSTAYTFRVKTKIGTTSSSGTETSATTQSGTQPPTSSKIGFVTISEIAMMGNTNRLASAQFYEAQKNEPPTIGGFGVAPDSCLVLSAGQNEPPQPASLKPLDAGIELSLQSGTTAYTKLLKTAISGILIYSNNPASPLAAVPDNLTISIPGSATGFPAFSNAALPAFPEDFTVSAPASGDSLALDGTITWDGGLNASNSMNIFISSSLKDGPGAICFAIDDGAFVLPSNVKSAFETAGVTDAKLFFMSRSANRSETSNGATLNLSVSRSKFML